MNTHTPGPWVVRDNKVISEHEDEPGLPITEVMWLYDEDGEANARLISASPDLLAACKDSLREILDGNDIREEEDHTSLVWRLHDAIAKAEQQDARRATLKGGM